MITQDTSSTRPYLIRALHEWCTHNGLTPYIAVIVDRSVQVPHEYVKNNEIVLNVSLDAVSSLKLGNDFIEFSARFSGRAREIMVPIGRVTSIYARESGQGMSFPVSATDFSSEQAPHHNALLSAHSAESELLATQEHVARLVITNPPTAGASEVDSSESPKSPSTPRSPLKRIK